MASPNHRMSSILPCWWAPTSPLSHPPAVHLDIVSSTCTVPAPPFEGKKVRFVAHSPFGSRHDYRHPDQYYPDHLEEKVSGSPGSDSFDSDQQSSGHNSSSSRTLIGIEISSPARTQEEWKIISKRYQEAKASQAHVVRPHSSGLINQKRLLHMSSNAPPFYRRDDIGGSSPEIENVYVDDQEAAKVIIMDGRRGIRHPVPLLGYDPPWTQPLGPTISPHAGASGSMITPLSSSASAPADSGMSMRDRLTRNTRRMLQNVGNTPPRPRRSSQRPVTADAVLQRGHGSATGTGDTTPKPLCRAASPPHSVAAAQPEPSFSPPALPQLRETGHTSPDMPISFIDLQEHHSASRRRSSPFSVISSRWTFGNVPSREDLLSLSSFASDNESGHPSPSLGLLVEQLHSFQHQRSQAADLPNSPNQVPTAGTSPDSPPWKTAVSPVSSEPPVVAAQESSRSSTAKHPSADQASAMDTARTKRGFPFFGHGSISRKKGEGFVEQRSLTGKEDRQSIAEDISLAGEATLKKKHSIFKSKARTGEGVAFSFGTRNPGVAGSSREERFGNLSPKSDRINGDNDTSYASISRASIASPASRDQCHPFGSLSSAGTGSLDYWTHLNPLLHNTLTSSTQRGSDTHEKVLTPKSFSSPSPPPNQTAKESPEFSHFASSQPVVTLIAAGGSNTPHEARHNPRAHVRQGQDPQNVPSGQERLPASATEASLSTLSQYSSFRSFPSDTPFVEPEASTDEIAETSRPHKHSEVSTTDRLRAAAQQFKKVVKRDGRDGYSVVMPESYLNYDPNPDPDGILTILEDTPKFDASSTLRYAEIPLASGTSIDLQPAPASRHQLVGEREQPSIAAGNLKPSDASHKLIHKRNPAVGLGIIVPPDPEEGPFATDRQGHTGATTMQAKIQAPMDRIIDRKSMEKKMNSRANLRKEKDILLAELAVQKFSEGGIYQGRESSQTSLRKVPSASEGVKRQGLRTFQGSDLTSRSPRRSRPQTAPTSTDSYYVQHPDILSSKSPHSSPTIPPDPPKKRGLIRRMFSKEGLIRQLGLRKNSRSKAKLAQASLAPAESAKESYEVQEARLLASAEQMATPVREQLNRHLSQRPLSGDHFMSESIAAASMRPLLSKETRASNQSFATVASSSPRVNSHGSPSPARTSSNIMGQDVSAVSSGIPKSLSYEGSMIIAPSPISSIRSLSRLASPTDKDQAATLPRIPPLRRTGDVLPSAERAIGTITEEGNSDHTAKRNADLDAYSSVTIARILSGGMRDRDTSRMDDETRSSRSDSSSSGAEEVALLQEQLARARARREERRRQKEALRARLAIADDDDRRRYKGNEKDVRE